MSKSLYLEKRILDGYIGGTALPAIPGTLYFALFTTSPTEGNDTGVEVSGGSYARKGMTNNSSNFSAATQTGLHPANKTNAAVITFTTPTANWGIVVAFGIYDAAAAGNLLYWGVVTPNVNIVSGTPISIANTHLSITET